MQTVLILGLVSFFTDISSEMVHPLLSHVVEALEKLDGNHSTAVSCSWLSL